METKIIILLRFFQLKINIHVKLINKNAFKTANIEHKNILKFNLKKKF